MAAVLGTDGLARVYTLTCSRAGCPAYYNPPLTTRRASDVRRLARGAGWWTTTSKKKRHRGDLCPDCRKEGQ